MVRAYTNAVLDALEKVNIVKKKLGYEVLLEINYKDLDIAKYFFENNCSNILNVEYLENIKINVEIDKNTMKHIEDEENKKGFEIIKLDILREKFV